MSIARRAALVEQCPVPIGWVLETTYKFVWDEWNLMAELDGADGMVRTMAWGPDMSGGTPEGGDLRVLHGAGGVGGLVFLQQEYNGPAAGLAACFRYDGNGNIVGVRRIDAGADVLEAGYDYGPFGETLAVRGSGGGRPGRWRLPRPLPRLLTRIGQVDETRSIGSAAAHLLMDSE